MSKMKLLTRILRLATLQITSLSQPPMIKGLSSIRPSQRPLLYCQQFLLRNICMVNLGPKSHNHNNILRKTWCQSTISVALLMNIINTREFTRINSMSKSLSNRFSKMRVISSMKMRMVQAQIRVRN
jgi:hypothetical protein